MITYLLKLHNKVTKNKAEIHNNSVVKQNGDNDYSVYMRAFFYALEKNHWDVIQCMIEYMDIKDINSAFINAVKSDNEPLVDFLIKKGANISTVDENNKSALVCAICANNEKIVEMLIAHDIDVNIIDIDAKNALIYAVENNNKKIVELLLKNKTEVNVIDKNYKSPLIYATQVNNNDIIRLLVEHNADINLVDKHRKNALIYAIEHNNTDIVKLFIKNKAKIDIIDENGKSALIYATQVNNKEIAMLLLKLGIDVNIMDTNTKSALIYAIENKNEEIVELLLNNGARIFDNKITACAFNSTEKILSLVLNKSVCNPEELLVNKMHTQNINKLKLLADHIHSIKIVNLLEIIKHDNDKLKITEKLLNNNIDINISQDSQLTPLIYAAQKGLPATTIKFMITRTRQEYLNYKDKYGNRAVDYLIKNDYDDELIEQWIKKACITGVEKEKINRNLKSRNLYNAVDNSDFDKIEKLIKQGADVNYKLDDTPIIALPLKVITNQRAGVDPESIKGLIEILLNNGAKYDPSINDLWKNSPPIIQELLETKWNRKTPKMSEYERKRKEQNIYERDVWATPPSPSFNGNMGYGDPRFEGRGSITKGLDVNFDDKESNS